MRTRLLPYLIPHTGKCTVLCTCMQVSYRTFFSLSSLLSLISLMCLRDNSLTSWTNSGHSPSLYTARVRKVVHCTSLYAVHVYWLRSVASIFTWKIGQRVWSRSLHEAQLSAYNYALRAQSDSNLSVKIRACSMVYCAFELQTQSTIS